MSGVETAAAGRPKRCLWRFTIPVASYTSELTYRSEQQATRVAAVIAGGKDFEVFMEHGAPAKCPHPR